MNKRSVVGFERAMKSVSQSVANFKQFVEGLNKFLQAEGLGSAEYCELYSPDIQNDRLGYEFAIFSMHDIGGKDLIYFHLYTNGTVTGENFVLGHERSRLGSGCSYIRAAEEVLRTIGVLNVGLQQLGKVEAAIKFLLG